MEIISNFSLKALNTFGIESFAKLFVKVNSIEQINELLDRNEFKNNHHLILGGGSNLLLTKNVEDDEKYLKLSNKIVLDLQYLYKVYGFIHWDLHTQNILVNKDITKYKLFDFDMSQLNYNGHSYKSCNYTDNKYPDNIKLHIRIGRIHTVYDVDIVNMIDYYSLFFQNKSCEDLFLSRCIGIENVRKLITNMESYFKNLTYENNNSKLVSNIPVRSNKNKIVSNILPIISPLL